MSGSLYRIAGSFLLAATLIAQEIGELPMFRSSSSLVLVPFNVERDNRYITDLQSSDFILREDGRPREFTVFEGPQTGKKLPVELILLFDTTSPEVKIPNVKVVSHLWEPKHLFEFLKDWDEPTTRKILLDNGAGIRISIYHFAYDQMERLCSATDDPREIQSAFGRLLDPIPAGMGKLALLPGDAVFGEETWGSPAWWQEATAATLKDVSASSVAAHRVVFLVSDLSFSTRAKPWDTVGRNALVLGIPVNPIILDPMIGRVGGTGEYFGWRGDSTGGETFRPQHLNRDTLVGILMEIRNGMLSRYYVGFTPALDITRKHVLKVELKSKSMGKLIGGERKNIIY